MSNEKRPRAKTVLIETASGRKLLLDAKTAYRQLGRKSGAESLHASGKANKFTSESARKASLKRWKRHPMTARGYRRGQRFTRRPNVPRQPLRELYSAAPVKGIQFHPDNSTWTLTDARGVRTISERTALVRLGHLPRANDHVVPERILKKVR